MGDCWCKDCCCSCTEPGFTVDCKGAYQYNDGSCGCISGPEGFYIYKAPEGWEGSEAANYLESQWDGALDVIRTTSNCWSFGDEDAAKALNQEFVPGVNAKLQEYGWRIDAHFFYMYNGQTAQPCLIIRIFSNTGLLESSG